MNIINKLVKSRLKDRNIELILLGGSVARGDETPHSDIDINLFVKNKKYPSRAFYKYKGKYIEETVLPIKSFNKKYLLEYVKVIYDKNKVINRFSKSDEKRAREKLFLKELKTGKQYLKLAENAYKEKNYCKSVFYLLGTKSLAFKVIHALPLKFNLPYPSFRLLESVKKASYQMKDKKIYEDIVKIYKNRNKNHNQILRKYSIIYKLAGKLNGNKGFYEPLKIKYNVEGLKLTLKNYPSAYALRFIINCVVDWGLDKNLWKKDAKGRANALKLTQEILGIKEFSKEFVENKLNLSKDLEKRLE